jgi:hypothetical protein
MRKIIAILLLGLLSCQKESVSRYEQAVKDFETNRGQIIHWENLKFGKPVKYKMAFDETERAKSLADSFYKYNRRYLASYDERDYQTYKRFDSILNIERTSFVSPDFTYIASRGESGPSMEYLIDTVNWRVTHQKVLSLWVEQK